MLGFFKKKEDSEQKLDAFMGEAWLSLADRLTSPDYYQEPPPSDAKVGAVEIDGKRCDACGLCVRICPSKTLILKERDKPLKKGKRTITKVMSMPEVPECLSCGDCAAICPNDAIQVSQRIIFGSSLFKTINKGPLSLPRLFNEDKKGSDRDKLL